MSIAVPTKVKLNIPQLTLARLAQTGRHQSGSQEVPGLTPTEGNIFAKFILHSIHTSLLPMLPTLYS